MMWLNKHWQTAVFLAVSILLFAPPARAQHTVRLEIRLRDSGGTAVSGEGMTLQRLPEASAAATTVYNQRQRCLRLAGGAWPLPNCI